MSILVSLILSLIFLFSGFARGMGHLENLNAFADRGSLNILSLITTQISFGLMVILIVLLYCSTYLQPGKTKKNYKPNNLIAILFMLLSYFIFLVRYHLGGNLSIFVDFSFIYRLLIIPVFLLILYLMFTLFNRNSLKVVINSINFFFLWILLMNIYLFIQFRSSTSTGAGRFFGSTDHPNFLGLLFSFFTLYWLLTFISSEILLKRFKKFFYVTIRMIYLLSFGFSIFFVIASGSRNALFSLLIILFVTFMISTMFNSYSKGFASFLTLFAALTLILLLLTVDVDGFLRNFNIYESFNRIFSDPSTLEESRGATLSTFLDSIERDPIFGIGSENQATSSSYLRLLATSGLVGFIPFALFLFKIFRQSSNVLLYSRKLNYLPLIDSLEEQRTFLVYSSNLSISLFLLMILALFEGFLFDSLSSLNLLFYCYIFSIFQFNQLLRFKV